MLKKNAERRTAREPSTGDNYAGNGHICRTYSIAKKLEGSVRKIQGIHVCELLFRLTTITNYFGLILLGCRNVLDNHVDNKVAGRPLGVC